MPSHNTGLGLAEILQATSSTAPNMLQRLGATLQGQPDPLQAFEKQDFTRRVGMANLLQQQEELRIKTTKAKREEKLFERGEEAIKEFQGAANLFASDPLGSLAIMASASLKAGDKDAFIKVFDLANTIKKDQATQKAFTTLRDRLKPAKTSEEAHKIIIDVIAETGSEKLDDTFRLLLEKAYPDKAKAILEDLDIKLKQKQLAEPSKGEPVNREAVAAVRKGVPLPGFTMEETKRMAGAGKDPKETLTDTVKNLFRRSLGDTVDDPFVQIMTPEAAVQALGKARQTPVMNEFIDETLRPFLGFQGGPTTAPAQKKLPTKADVEKADRQAGGDKRKRNEILRQQGFTVEAK